MSRERLPTIEKPGPPRQPPVVTGYRLRAHQRIPIHRVSIAALASVPIWLALFLGLAALVDGSATIDWRFDVTGGILAIVVLGIGVPAVHELIHGIAALAAGARPSFGVGAGYAYTTFRKPVGKYTYVAISLAPIVVISLIGLINLVSVGFASGLTLIALVGNAAGAFGDLWITWRMRRVEAGAVICDLADGFAVYSPDEVAREASSAVS